MSDYDRLAAEFRDHEDSMAEVFDSMSKVLGAVLIHLLDLAHAMGRDDMAETILFVLDGEAARLNALAAKLNGR